MKTYFDRPEDLAFDADLRRRRRLGQSMKPPRGALPTLQVNIQRAAAMLASAGWAGPEHEPWCVLSSTAPWGEHCLHDDEGISKYSVAGALAAYGAREAGLATMERSLAPHRAELQLFVETQGSIIPPDSVWLEDGQLWSASQHREFWRLQLLADDEPELMPWLQDSARVVRDVLRLMDLAAKAAA